MRMAMLRAAGRRRAQLQHQAFAEVARAHAGGLQALQPAQRALQARPQVFAGIGAADVQHLGQALGDLFQRVGQVAVLVERLDQHLHRRRSSGDSRMPGNLRAQVVLQRAGRCRGPGLDLVAIAAAAGCRCGASRGCRRSLRARCRFPSRRARWCRTLGASIRPASSASAASPRVALGVALARSVGRAPLGRRLEGLPALFLDFEEGVLLEHLLDFLVQLQRGELQQPDRLLQLRRERQVLRKADLQ